MKRLWVRAAWEHESGKRPNMLRVLSRATDTAKPDYHSPIYAMKYL